MNQDQEFARLSDEAREQRLAAVLNAAMTRKSSARGQLAKPAPLNVEEDKPELAHTPEPEVEDDEDGWDMEDTGGEVEWD